MKSRNTPRRVGAVLVAAVGLSAAACSSSHSESGGTNNNDKNNFNPNVGNDAGKQNCGASALQAKPRPVNVVILLDRSASMDTALSATEPKTRWQAMREALNTALTAVQDKVAFGLKLFPDSTQDCAVTQAGLAVNLTSGSSSVTAIDQAIAAATPGGGTPIADALKQVDDYFTTGAGSTLEGDRVVLLATDGAPNCNSAVTCDATACIPNIEHPLPDPSINMCQSDTTQCLDDARAEQQVTALLSHGVKTAVVGIPGTEYTQYKAILNQLGAAGGLSNPDPNYDYFPVSAASGVAGLETTLENITANLIVSCKLQLTSEPPEIGLLNVVIDGNTVPQANANGWSIDASTSPPTVVLSGTTCDYMEQHGAQSVDITYGCPTVVN